MFGKGEKILLFFISVALVVMIFSIVISLSVRLLEWAF